MKIYFNLSRTNEKKEIELKEGSTVEDLLKEIEIKPDTVIVIYENNPIPVNSTLVNNQFIKLIQVSSGG